MRFTYLIFAFILFFANCKNDSTTQTKENEVATYKSENENILSENNLAKQIFTVDIQKDNSLITQSGVIIQIPKGSLESEKNPVQLEVKEAINMKDIFLAGLQTTSNGEILSSGGMIKIVTSEGYNVTIKQKIKVHIPTQNYNAKMQVFDGEKDSSGKINWVNPMPLPKTAMNEKMITGEQLFMSNCSSCHDPKMMEGKTGPTLWNVQERRSKEWLYAFTRNSAAVISQNENIRKLEKENRDFNPSILDHIDSYAECIYNQWNKTAMTGFPKLTDKELNAIYTFIKTESDKNPGKVYPTCCDSCETYGKVFRKEQIVLSKMIEEQNQLFSLKQTISLNKNKLVAKQTNNVVFKNIPDPNTSTNRQVVNPVVANVSEYVSPELYTGVYYDLEITTFGWKNIDILIEDGDGVIKSQLFATVKESEKFKMRVQLLIPTYKISLDGGRVEGNQFAFKTKDGNILLPQGIDCYVVALSEIEDKLYFDLKRFSSTTKQTIELEMSEVSPEKMNSMLNGLIVEGLKSKVKEKEHMKEIRKLEKEIEKVNQKIDNKTKELEQEYNRMKIIELLKPKNCDCGINNISEYFVKGAPYPLEDTQSEKGFDISVPVKEYKKK